MNLKMTNKQRIDALHKRQAIHRALQKRLEKEHMTEVLAPTVSVQEYDYLVVDVFLEDESKKLFEKINEGWELVSVSPDLHWIMGGVRAIVLEKRLYFKRKKAT